MAQTASVAAADAGAPVVVATQERSYNRFLDFVRTVAILRVLAWHTYGYAWLSYFVASMPAMFFVAGSLMAQSLQRDSWVKVLQSRFRRLLIPLWAFGLVALGVMLLHAQARPIPGEQLQWWQPIFWVFPIWDPQGSEWGITFWAVLWYMRCLTWLILLSPLLFWLFQRLSIALIGLPLGLLVVFEQLRRQGNPVPWQYEDVALFGIFWLLGFAYNAGYVRSLSTYARGGATIGFAVAAAIWVLTQDVPNMVVNASYPAHLLVGLTWLSLALTFERPIARFAASGWPGRLIAWVNDRSFTIYLWHAAGLFAMYEILWVEQRPDWVRATFALPIVLAVTFTCMIAFGWIEDLAARRDLHLAPRAGRQASHRPHMPTWRSAWLLPLGAGIGLIALFGAVLEEVVNPPGPDASVVSAIPPSGVGIGIRASRVRVLDKAPEPATTDIASENLGPVTPADLQLLIDQWREEFGQQGVAVALRRPDGSAWSGASGIDVFTGEPLTADYIYPVLSVTKTFTTAIVLQLVEAGSIGLDDPVSNYVPGIAHSGDYTVRHLIQHTSGLMATDGVAPSDALYAATEEGLAFEPGSSFLYSSPGYFMLGLLIEKVTGVSYTQGLHERLLSPLALDRTLMDEELFPTEESTHPVPNPALRSSSGVLRSAPGIGTGATPAFSYFGILWSSAGIHSTVVDLATWAVAFWDESGFLAPESRAAMSAFLGVEYQYAGLATYPYCPCWFEDSQIKAQRWGHYGRSGVLEYDPHDRIAVSIYTSGTDIDEAVIVAYDELSVRLRGLVKGRAFTP